MSKQHNIQKEKLNVIIDSILSIVLSLLTIASVFFFIFPNINQYLKLKHKVNEQKQVLNKLNQKYKNIQTYSEYQLDDLYKLTTNYLPENINIAEMGNTINNIAKQYNLKIERLSLSETTENRPITVKSENKDKELLTLPLKSVTAPFLITGKKQDLINFIDQLTGSLEAREFTTVQLMQSKDNAWSLRLTLTHLYMPYINEIPISEDLPNLDTKMLSIIQQQAQNQNIQNIQNLQNLDQPNNATTANITQ